MSEPEKAEEKPEQKSEKVLRDDAAKTVTTQPKSGIRKVRDIVLWILTVVMVLSVVVAVISGMGVMSVAYIIAAVVLCPKFKPEMGFWKRILIMFWSVDCGLGSACYTLINVKRALRRNR